MLGGRLPCWAVVNALIAMLQQVSGLVTFDAVEREDSGSHDDGGVDRGGRLLDTMVFYVSAVSSRCV